MDFTDAKITAGLYRCQDLKKVRQTEIIILPFGRLIFLFLLSFTILPYTIMLYGGKTWQVAFSIYYSEVALTLM